MVFQHVTFSCENPTLHYAAQELSRHLNMVTAVRELDPGTCLTLAVRQPEDPIHDLYNYNVSEQQFQFEGSNARSVLLAVYDYLRSLGFVFHDPGRDGTFVPRISGTASLLCSGISRTASFTHRGVCIEGADSLQNVLDFIDWLPKNGYNAFFVQFKKPDTFFERWYNHVNNPLLPAEHPDRKALDDMEQQITAAMSLRGILDHRVGHGWTAGALGCEATGWDAEKNSLSQETLSMAAMVQGKRQLFRGIPTNTNLCYSNPAARQRLIDQVVSYAAAHPSVDYLHFWLADMANNVCECDACRKTTLSDQYVSILNDLDEKLRSAGLSTKIVFLLYQELLYVPDSQRIRNPDRFCLMFAPISRTFEKSYPRMEKTVPIRPYVRNQFCFPETVEENLTHYFNWKKIYDGDCFFYDYPLGRAHYGDFGYMKIARVIYDDIHALKDLGSRGYMSCQELRVQNPTGFPNFVMGQALLDDSIPYDSLRKTYFESRYGRSWDAAASYLETLSELSDTDYFNGHGSRLQPEKKEQFRKIIRTAEEFLLEIPTLRDPDPRFSPYWEDLQCHGRGCILLADALSELCCGNQPEADEKFRTFCEYIRRQEPARQSRLDVYRVIEVSCGYTGFSQP